MMEYAAAPMAPMPATKITFAEVSPMSDKEPYDYAGQLKRWVDEFIDSRPPEERERLLKERAQSKIDDAKAQARHEANVEACRKAEREFDEAGGYCGIPYCGMLKSHSCGYGFCQECHERKCRNGDGTYSCR